MGLRDFSKVHSNSYIYLADFEEILLEIEFEFFLFDLNFVLNLIKLSN